MSRHRRRSTATARQRDPGTLATWAGTALGNPVLRAVLWQCKRGEWACPLLYGLKQPGKCWSLLSQNAQALEIFAGLRGCL